MPLPSRMDRSYAGLPLQVLPIGPAPVPNAGKQSETTRKSCCRDPSRPDRRASYRARRESVALKKSNG
jgi:hypothetical protein